MVGNVGQNATEGNTWSREVKPLQQPGQTTSLNLRELQKTPGFMVRLVQLKFFEGFYEHFAEFGLTPATYAILMLIRDNPGVPPSALASLLRLKLPNLIKILNELEFDRHHQAQSIEGRSSGRRIDPNSEGRESYPGGCEHNGALQSSDAGSAQRQRTRQIVGVAQSDRVALTAYAEELQQSGSEGLTVLEAPVPFVTNRASPKL